MAVVVTVLPLLLLLLSLLTPPALRVEATSKFPDRQQGVNACQLTTCCDFCCYCRPPSSTPLLTHTQRHTLSHSHSGGCRAELAQFSFSHSYLCSILLRAASFLCLFPHLFLVGLFPFALLSTCSFPSHVSRAHQLTHTHTHTHTLAQLQLQLAFNFSEFKAQKHKRKRAKPSENKTNQSKTKAKKYEKRREKNEQNVKRKAKFKRLHINQRDSPHLDFDSDAVADLPHRRSNLSRRIYRRRAHKAA